MKLRVKDVSVENYNRIVRGELEAVSAQPGIDNRICNLVRDKLKLGAKDKGCPGSTWGAFSGMLCLLRYLCCRNVEAATDIRSLLSSYGMGGNRAAENYTFGEDATFQRTVPMRASLQPDYERLLEGCTPEDSLEKVISHLYRLVLEDKRNAYKNAAQHVFGVSL